MTNTIALVQREQGEALGPITYDTDVKYIIRETIDRDYITVYVRVSSDTEQVTYKDLNGVTMRDCHLFAIKRIYNDGGIQEMGKHLLPVTPNGKPDA